MSHHHLFVHRAEQCGLRVSTSASLLQRHSHDVGCVSGRGRVVCVVAATSEADVAKTLALATQLRVAVIAFAAGSSLEGHTVPQSRDSVILDVSGMDRVVAVHSTDLDCVVEPGVGWTELRETLKPLGLFFPPDPGAAACIGGMCGTNCSGTLAFRYGTMKDNVLSLRVALADGRVIQTRHRAVKSSAGYDLTRLFIGSEGTLGIVTQATLRLRRIPAVSRVVLAQFTSLAHASSTVQSLVLSGVPYMRIEIMDDACVGAVNNDIEDPALRFKPLTTLLVECAAPSLADVQEQIEAFKFAIASEALSPSTTTMNYNNKNNDKSVHVVIAESDAESERLWNLRKRAFFSAKSLRQLKNPTKHFQILVTDVAVPISRLTDILEWTKNAIAHRGLVAPLVAHAGDGNYHCLVVVEDGNAQERMVAEAFKDEMARVAIGMGGTISGEHGIGIGKMHLLEEELGHETLEVMRTIKRSLDPLNILNPGKIFSMTSAPERNVYNSNL